MSLLENGINIAKQQMIVAMQNQDEEAFTSAIDELAKGIEQNVLEQARQTSDANVLSTRGNRALTSKENKFYSDWIKAGKSDNPKSALANVEVTFPETIINQVFEEITESHPLLSAINFTNTSGAIKFLVSKSGRPTAKWGALTDEITKEIDADLAEIDMSLEMLSAFIPVSKAMLDLGPIWLDNYVRTFLSESIANGLESGIVSNLDTATGPIGMMADLSKGSLATDQSHTTYTAKTATALNSLLPEDLDPQLAKLAKNEQGVSRTVDGVILVVNPEDYFSKVLPATTVLSANGTYTNNVLPYPIQIIQSSAIDKDKAVLGLGKKYFMGLGASGQAGRIEFSDEYKFIEHKRYYKTYLYGNGRPMDNNAFLVLNISKLKPAYLKVEQVSSSTTSTGA